LATKDGCAAHLAASGDRGCGVYRVDEALLAFSTASQKLQTAARSAANGVSKVQKMGWFVTDWRTLSKYSRVILAIETSRLS